MTSNHPWPVWGVVWPPPQLAKWGCVRNHPMAVGDGSATSVWPKVVSVVQSPLRVNPKFFLNGLLGWPNHPKVLRPPQIGRSEFVKTIPSQTGVAKPTPTTSGMILVTPILQVRGQPWKWLWPPPFCKLGSSASTFHFFFLI